MFISSRFLIFFFVLSNVLLTTSWSMEVLKVRGKKVLVKLNGEVASVGQTYLILDENGNRKGVSKIIKVQGDRAISVMSSRSKARQGWSLQFQSSGSSTSNSVVSSPYVDSSESSSVVNSAYGSGSSSPYSSGASQRSGLRSFQSSGGKTSFGFLGGINKANIKVSNLNGEATNTSMDGKGYSLEVFGEQNLARYFWLRGTAGIEKFDVDEGSKKNCMTKSVSNNCAAELQYATVGLIFQIHFLEETQLLRPWLGIGGKLAFPTSKSSTAINVDTVKITRIFNAVLGADIGLSRGLSIPVQFEYNIFPKSGHIKSKYFALKVGFKIGI